jgi:hypothetical protein
MIQLVIKTLLRALLVFLPVLLLSSNWETSRAITLISIAALLFILIIISIILRSRKTKIS